MSNWEQDILEYFPTQRLLADPFLNGKINRFDEEVWIAFDQFLEERHDSCLCKNVNQNTEEEEVKKTVKVKTFMNGGSQAIRIPAECRFDDPEVYLTYDTETGVVTINKSGSSGSIEDLLDYFEANPLPDDLPHNFFKSLWPKDDFRDRLAEFDRMQNEVSN